MVQIKNEAAYWAALKGIDELLPSVSDNTPKDDKNYLVSEIMNGKSEPSLKIGREISRQLNIDLAIVLGV